MGLEEMVLGLSLGVGLFPLSIEDDAAPEHKTHTCILGGRRDGAWDVGVLEAQREAPANHVHGAANRHEPEEAFPSTVEGELQEYLRWLEACHHEFAVSIPQG